MRSSVIANESSIKRIIKGAFGVSAYSGLYQIAVLLTSIISARHLTTEDFGKLSILQSTSSLFIMLATMGLGTVAIKLVAESGRKYVGSVLVLNLILSASFSIVLFLLAPYLAKVVYQDSSLVPLLELFSPYILLSSFFQVQSSVVAGREEYSILAKINLCIGATSLIVIYLMLNAFGLFGWIYGLILLELVKVTLMQWVIHRRFHSLQLLKARLHFSYVSSLAIPIAISGFFIMPANWFLTRELLIQSGYTAVAVLNIANQWIAILTFFPIALGNAMLPILSKLTAGTKRNDLSALALKINFVLSIISSTFVALLAVYIMTLYGAEYAESANVFWYLVPLVVVLSLTNQYNNKVVADGKPKFMVYANLVWFIVNLPMTLALLAWGGGVNGVVLGRFIAYLAKLGVLARLAGNKSIK